MEGKKWYTSKTEIINILALAGIILNYFFGFEIDTELQAALATVILAVVNMVLRKYTTQPLK